MMCLLFPIPNSSLPDKQDGLTRTWVIEPGKKPLMSSLTPPATAHVLTAMRAVQKCLGLLNGRRLCRLDGLPLCQSAPTPKAKTQTKTAPNQVPLQPTGHGNETELPAENEYSLCHASGGNTGR